MASESRRAGGMTPPMGVPSPSPRRRLLGAGFAEPDRALRALEDRALADLLTRASGGAAEAGDRLITIEAMKMEAAITANVTGTVTRLAFEGARPVEAGDLVLVVEVDED